MAESKEEEYTVDPGLVEALHRKVKTQDEVIEDLEGVIEGLEGRIEALENGSSSNGSDSSAPDGEGYDSYDQPVVDALTAGRMVSLPDLQRLYRTEAGLKNRGTIKQRIQGLVAGNEFERMNVGKWQYLPDAEESEESEEESDDE